MPADAISDDEATRLAALERYDILDTLPETAYDDLTLLASQICEAPISTISLVDSRRQWFKSHPGFDIKESPRESSFCAHAIGGRDLLEVPDATLDARFVDSVLVTGEQKIRFYAGAPLVTPDGLALGTLCVFDCEPRQLTPVQRAALGALSRQVMALLELRRSVAQLEESNRELQNHREEFRSFMDNSPVVAFTKDRAGRMIYVNKCWEDVFGISFARVRGRCDCDWMPREIAASIRQNDRTVLEQNRVLQIIERVPTPDNPTCEWLVFKFPIGEGEGAKLGGVALDLTELRRAEKLKNEFVAVVSHELRTPLTSMRGALGLLNNNVVGELSPQAREMIGMALRNAERLALLINDLLDMEKIESGAMKFAMGAHDLGALLENALELNAAYAATFGVRLQLEPLAHELRNVRVCGDFDRLTQVLTNLISNAAKFTRAAGEVWVRAHRAEDRVRIEVRDQGQGVPAEFVSRLFERFAQADTSSTRQRGGTGLGLAISRAIIAKHGTDIGYQAPNENRAGATFFFELHLAQTLAPNETAV